MSGAVGSIPSLTRSGRFSAFAAESLSASAPFGRSSTALVTSALAGSEASSAAASVGFPMHANARLSPSGGSHRAALAAPSAIGNAFSSPAQIRPQQLMSEDDRTD